MTGHLRCYSFHSVKGGVGKSTLSTALALGLARRHVDTPVVLIDLDLTGTSLSDVLDLCAPNWLNNQIDLRAVPDAGFLSLAETRERIRDREPERSVPFLNDFLLATDPDWSTDNDIVPKALQWELEGGPQNLRVIPSSALPVDLERIIPVIFDEEHAPFLEARIEVLLDALMPSDGEAFVVIDTPPTIPGLSRSVISLGFRLARDPKLALADDGYIPARIEAGVVDWQVGMVLSSDTQDLSATERWLSLVGPDEQERVRVFLNRLSSGEPEQLYARIFGGGVGTGEVLSELNFQTLESFPKTQITEEPELAFFQREARLPEQLEALVDKLIGAAE